MQSHKEIKLIQDPTADIYQLPKCSENPAKHLSIGDLHANAIKLLYYLVREGVAEISSGDYQQLVAIYKKSPPKKEDIDNFKRIVSQINIINSSAKVRLLGDELADRGQNDYYVLLILKQLREKNVKVQVVVSNHGYDFIKAVEEGSFKASQRLLSDLGPEQAKSMHNMHQAINQGMIDKDEVNELIQQTYFPALKLISYSLDKKGIHIYTHAPSDINVIRCIAEKLKVEFNDSTADQLAKTIDDINEAFQTEYVNKGNVKSLFAGLAGNPGPERTPCAEDPFVYLIWNRQYQGLKREGTYKGYQVAYVHGHDSSDTAREDHIVNLDNGFGKGLHANRGTYQALHTMGESLKSRELRQRRLSLPDADVLLAASSAPVREQPSVDNEPSFFHRLWKNICSVATFVWNKLTSCFSPSSVDEQSEERKQSRVGGGSYQLIHDTGVRLTGATRPRSLSEGSLPVSSGVALAAFQPETKENQPQPLSSFVV